MVQPNASRLPGKSTLLADEQLALLTAVLAASNDAIVGETTNGIITAWNTTAERIFGYTAEEVIGHLNTLIISAERLTEEKYLIGQLLQGKEVQHYETVRLTKEGSQVPVSINASAIINGKGIVTGVCKVISDISSRQESDEKQARLAAIVATSDDAIISKTLEGIISSWNLAAANIFGYTEEEAVGQHISMIIPADRLNEEDFIIGQIAKGNRVDHFETVRRAKDGREVHLSVTVSPVVDIHGKVIGASKVARDISVRKQSVEKQGMLAAIVGSSDDTIVSKTLEGKITSWNKAAESMFGYSEREAIGQHISLIIPKERLNEETYIISEVSKGNKVDHFETVRIAKGGKMIPISLSVSPIVDENGKIIGASKIARDISEHLSIQQDKARLYDEIKALNDKKDEFIGLASHELKTPLTSVQGYLQIMKNDMSEERRKEFLHRAGEQVKKLNNLVSDLLDISKIEAGKLQFNPAPFDLCQVTQDAIELIAYSSKNHQIELFSDLNTLCLNGDGQRIEQVILNLLTNAIRYAPGSNNIQVYLSQENNNAKVGVRDHGIGIATDKLEHVFSRFYRIGENNNVSGLGIGLYLSKQIIDRHGGNIWAESTPGEGSVFYFTIPIKMN